MNHNTQRRLIAVLKKPSTQLIAVIIIGLLLNLYLLTAKVWPDFQDNIALKGKVNSLLQQKEVIEKSPLPDELNEDEVKSLFLQVPTKLELSRILLEVGTIEQETGATVTSLLLGEQEAEADDELLAFIESSSNTKPVNPLASQEPAQDNDESVPITSEPTLATPIVPELLTLRAVGTYPQMIQFMERLYELDRIVNIRQWSFVPQNEDQYEVEFNLTVYSAPKYAGDLHDLPTFITEKP